MPISQKIKMDVKRYMVNKIKSIDIVTSPFGCIPPNALGAVEKLWKSCGDYYASIGIKVTFVCKRPNERHEDNCVYVDGYDRTGSWLLDFLLDFYYSLKALIKAPKADVIVLNTIWTPVLLPFFKWKFRVSLYNVARFPKHQFGLYRGVDALSCVSVAVYESLARQTPSAKKRACVIPNFIDTRVFHFDGVRALSSGIPCIVYSGRVHIEKGLELLVKAINLIREKRPVSLRIIGTWDVKKGGSGDGYKGKLDSLAVGWSIDWYGPVYSPTKLAEEIGKCDIFCYPSVAEKGETFGVAPLEAMGLGLPVVVSSLDCFKDFVRHGVNGYVFDHRQEDAHVGLAANIMNLFDNPGLYGKFSRNAMLMAKSFSVEAIADEYLCLFNNLYEYHCLGFDEKNMKVKEIKTKT